MPRKTRKAASSAPASGRQNLKYPTSFSSSIAALHSLFKQADDARDLHQDTYATWAAASTPPNLQRRTRLRALITDRDMDQLYPTSNAQDLSSCVIRLKDPTRMLAEVKKLTDLREALPSDADFTRAVNGIQWSAEMRAVFAKCAPACWMTELSCFGAAPRWALILAILPTLTEIQLQETSLNIRMFLEIACGPGSATDKIHEIQRHHWDFEVEDTLFQLKLWRPVEHVFQAGTFDNNTATERIRPALLGKTNARWHSPETPPATPESVWMSTAREALHQVADPITRAAGVRVLNDPAATEEQRDLLKHTFKGTDLASLSACSGWTRSCLPGAEGQVQWHLPSFAPYSRVGVRAFAINTQSARIVSDAFVDKLLRLLQQGDASPERIEAFVVRWMEGPTTLGKCWGGKHKTSGGQARLEVSWCDNLRKLLQGQIHLEVEGMRVGFVLDVPPEFQVELRNDTTAPFLAACKAKGLSEPQAIRLLARALKPVLPSLAAIYIQPCSFLPDGKGPNKFWDWWEPPAIVKLGFLDEASALRVAASDALLVLHDGYTIDSSALAVRVWVRPLPPGRRGGFTLVQDQARADTCAHLLLKGWTKYTMRGMRAQFGMAALNPAGIEQAVLEWLRPIVGGRLPDKGVECIRDARGNWKMEDGMRVFCDVKDHDTITKALKTGVSPWPPHPSPFLILPSQPVGTLDIVWKAGKPFSQMAAATAAPASAAAASSEAATVTSLSEAAELLYEEVEKYHGRVYLPSQDDQLFRMSHDPVRGTVTLRALYNKLKIDTTVSPSALADAVCERYPDALRDDDRRGDQRFLICGDLAPALEVRDADAEPLAGEPVERRVAAEGDATMVDRSERAEGATSDWSEEFDAEELLNLERAQRGGGQGSSTGQGGSQESRQAQ